MIQVINFFKFHRVTALLSRQFRTIASAAFIISVTSLVSRVLGLIRDHALAFKFGAGQDLDIYYAAFRVPDLLYNLLVLGALSAGFIPIFTSYLRVQDQNQEINGTKKAWDLVNILFHVLVFVIGGVSILLVLTAPYFVEYLVPGFDEVALDKTIRLTQIMFLSPFFLSLSSLFGGILQSFKRFFVYSLAPIVYNIGIIIGVLYFYDIFGLNGLAYGVVLGAFFHMLIQIPFVFKLGYNYKWLIDLKNTGLRKILTMMIPRTMGLAIVQINLIVVTILASKFGEGSLSIFNFANNLQSVPIGLFGISFAIASFPTLSQYADQKNWKGFSHTFSSTTRQIIFFIVPITVLYIIFRAQIVRLVLGSGAFNWEDTVLTLRALGLFSISLFAQSLIPLLARTFYTLQDSKTPFVIAFVAMVLNITLSIILGNEYGILGLVAAFSIAAVLQFIMLWISLYSKVGNLHSLPIVISTGKVLLASLAMGTFAQGIKVYIGTYININTVPGILLQTGVASIIGLIIFMIVSHVLGNKEMEIFYKAINRRLFKRIDIPQGKIE